MSDMSGANRPLGLWEATTALNARRLLGASQMVILGEGRGPLTEEAANQATQDLFARHELLQCRLSDESPVPRLIRDVRPEDIPCLTHHADSEAEVIAIWEQLLREELPDCRRLWEVRLAPASKGDRWRVFIKVHHAIADGRSMAGMLRQFIALAATRLQGEAPDCIEIPVPPPAERRVASPVSRAQWLEAMAQAGEDRPITPWPLDEEAEVARRRPRVAFRSLNPARAEALHQACRAEGTTVLGGLVAAICRTHAAHAGGVVDTDRMVPIDMRRLFPEPPDPDEIQMGAYGVRIFLPQVKSSDDPWQLARRFRTALEPMLQPAAAPHWDFTEEDVIDFAAPWTDLDGAYRHGFCTSNVGVLPFDGDAPPLQTDRIDMTAAVHFGGFPILVPLLMHKGVLRAGFTWTEPLMHDDTAASWIEDVWIDFTSLARR